MRCLSLFSGIGGFDLALVRLNHKIVGACEIDKYAREIYAKHFPGVPIHDDVTTLQTDTLPQFDLLCGGFPCQAFSVAGQRLGFDDPRGNLFFEIARIAKEKRPRYLFLENVRGLLFHDKGETIREMLRILDEVGYDAEWQVLNSKNHGVPQTRERIFIIGHLRGASTRQVFPLGEIREINAGSSCETQEQRQRIRSQTSGAIDANYAKGGGSRTMIACVMTGHQSQNGRKVSEDYSFALTTRREQYLASLQGVRSLTPLECERLQGFPDGWTEGISDTQRYKCLGNAVTVPVVEYIAKHLTEPIS